MLLDRLVYWSSKKSNLMRDFYRSLAFNMEMSLLAGYRKDPRIVRMIKQIRKETHLLVTAGEAYQVYTTALAQADRPGDMAEVGVYRGGTAKLICEAKGATPLHLFDTFAGLPEPDKQDGGFFKSGWYAGQLEKVRAYLKAYPNVYFYQGVFPQTSAPIQDVTFSFVHLDVDLYIGTKQCLAFFYPRMVKGGVIIVHDYQLAGVKQAIQDFDFISPDRVLELNNTQLMIVKL